MKRVNEFLLRTKKGEFGISQRRLLVRERSKINGLKEQTDLTFFPKEALHLLPLREKRGAEIRRD